MKASPTFVLTAAACAVPFVLAIRQDLHGAPHLPRWEEGAWTTVAPPAAPPPVDYTQDEPPIYAPPPPTRDLPPSAVDTRQVTADDLDELAGAAPATMGPVLDGVALGAPSTSFLPDITRERIEAFKLDHDVTVDFDFDDVTLFGVTVRLAGDAASLRDALVSRWGRPRQLDAGELVWLGAGSQRAVYTAMSDGADLRFEQFSTIDAILAPQDKARLGVEPFPLLGASRKKLEQAIGPRLQESSSEDELSWALPGIGNGSGTTMVKVTLDDGDRIDGLVIEGATDDIDAVREALITKWGPPGGDDGLLTWSKKGVRYEVELWSHGFSLTARR